MLNRLIHLPALFFFLIGCGSLQFVPLANQNASSGGSEQIETFLFATDYASTGQLLTVSGGQMTNSGVTQLGSSAIVRFFEDKLYILHDGFSFVSQDNVQVLDPSTFSTLHQFSTGNQTNPHDLVVIDNLAYISLYNPEKDPQNLDSKGNPGDVIIMNLEDGKILSRLSFQGFLNPDGSRTARASCMAQAGDFIYVCIQDLEGDLFAHNASGKVGVIDTKTQTISQVIPLQGRNPLDLAVSLKTNKLYVALLAPYDYATGNFDLDQPYGGVEIVSLQGGASKLIADEDLGGYVEKLSISTEHLYLTASQFKPLSFEFISNVLQMDLRDETTSLYLEGSQDIREMAVDSDDHLWISRRTLIAGKGEATAPAVDIFDAGGQRSGSSFIPPVPVTSMTFKE